jgi:phosphohistidine phosphatase
MFGHNPTITAVANILTNSTIENIPTCGIVCIEFKGNSWKATESASMLWFDFPKNHTL